MTSERVGFFSSPQRPNQISFHNPRRTRNPVLGAARLGYVTSRLYSQHSLCVLTLDVVLSGQGSRTIFGVVERLLIIYSSKHRTLVLEPFSIVFSSRGTGRSFDRDRYQNPFLQSFNPPMFSSWSQETSVLNLVQIGVL